MKFKPYKCAACGKTPMVHTINSYVTNSRITGNKKRNRISVCHVMCRECGTDETTYVCLNRSGSIKPAHEKAKNDAITAWNAAQVQKFVANATGFEHLLHELQSRNPACAIMQTAKSIMKLSRERKTNNGT